MEEGIIHFADQINADMIAMATHGRRGFAHVMAGSVAEDVVVTPFGLCSLLWSVISIYPGSFTFSL